MAKESTNKPKPTPPPKQSPGTVAAPPKPDPKVAPPAVKGDYPIEKITLPNNRPAFNTVPPKKSE